MNDPKNKGKVLLTFSCLSDMYMKESVRSRLTFLSFVSSFLLNIINFHMELDTYSFICLRLSIQALIVGGGRFSYGRKTSEVVD